jgi:uncharacterized membrane protein HdeD (DUF308 family)
MKVTTLLGILLILLGIVAFTYQGITYRTREKVVDLGPIEATAEREKTIPLPPVLGALAFIGGVILVVAGTRGQN